jgi:hypothetical protein
MHQAKNATDKLFAFTSIPKTSYLLPCSRFPLRQAPSAADPVDNQPKLSSASATVRYNNAAPLLVY